MVRWTIPWYVDEAEGRRARQCSCGQPSLTILCATLPDLLQSPPWVKILPWDPLPCQNLPHWDMHTCAHTCWCAHTHTHLALARKLVRSLCPSLFYPVTRHSSFTHSRVARWPQCCLANVHHSTVATCLPLHSKLLTPYPFCIGFSQGSFGLKEQRHIRAGSTTSCGCWWGRKAGHRSL